MAAIGAVGFASAIGTKTFGAALAGLLVTTVGTYVDNVYVLPRLFGESPERPELGSVEANYAEVGAGAQFCYGDLNRVPGQYIYASKPYSLPGSGGSGKRGAPAQVTWYIDAAIAFVWNEIGRFNQLMFDGERVYEDDPGAVVSPPTSEFDQHYDKANSVQEWSYSLNPSSGQREWSLVRWYATFETIAPAEHQFITFRAGDKVRIKDTNGFGALFHCRVIRAEATANGTQQRLVVDLVNHWINQSWATGQNPNQPTNEPSVATGNYPWPGPQNTLNEPWSFVRDDSQPWKKNLVNEAGVEYFLGKNQPQVSTVIGNAFGTSAPALPGIAYIAIPKLNVSAFGNRAPHVTGLISQSDNKLTTLVEQRTADQAVTYFGKTVGGIPAAYLSSNIPYNFAGLTWVGTQETHALMAQLMLAYGVESFEADGIRQFRLKKTSSAIQLDPIYLGARPVGQPPRPRVEGYLEVDRGALPRRLNVKYPSAEINRDLQDDSQHATRDGLQDANATDAEDRQVSLAIPMTDLEARALAATMLQTVWDETGSATLRLPWLFAHLTETDQIEFTSEVDGRSWAIVVTQVDHTATFDVLLKVSVRVDSSPIVAAAYGTGASETNSPAIFGRESALRTSAAVTIMVLDIPAFRHEDAVVPGVYIATGNPDPTAPWRGAQVYMSTADNAQYVKIGDGRQATTGHTTGGTALSAVTPGTYDAVSSITVKLLTGGPLSSVTQQEAADGKNLARIGRETVNFVNAALQGDGSYILTGFYRGRQATEDAIGEHTAGNTPFVILDSNVVHMRVGLENIGKARDFQALPAGVALETYPEITLASLDANTVRSAPPANLAGYREPDNDVALTWERRSRVPVNDLGPTVVPLPEYSESYTLYIDDSGGDLVRTVTGLTSPSYTYTAAMQTTDGTNASDFTARVVQVDAISGDGRQATLLVPAP